MAARNRRYMMAVGLILCGSLLASCVTIPGLPGFGDGSPIVENPLNGTPLQYSAPARGLPFERERACSFWPIDNALTVTVTAEKICIRGKLYKLVGASSGTPGGTDIVVGSDGSGEEEIAMFEGEFRSKVGECFDKTTTKGEQAVWMAEIDRCLINQGAEFGEPPLMKPTKDGKPILTKKSTFLRVADARWRFPEAKAKSKK